MIGKNTEDVVGRGVPGLAVQANLQVKAASAAGRNYKPRNLAKSVTVE